MLGYHAMLSLPEQDRGLHRVALVSATPVRAPKPPPLKSPDAGHGACFLPAVLATDGL